LNTMKLGDIYRTAIKKGIEEDLRSAKEISELLARTKKNYEKLTPLEKDCFDTDSLFNPYADTRILHGEEKSLASSIGVGIDIDGSELLLLDRLNSKGAGIDLAISHHPAGRAYASFFEVMDLQIDAFRKEGISASVSENLLLERKLEIERRVHAANHQRTIDLAKALNIPFLCIHTPCDNCAHQYIAKLMAREKPDTLGKVLDILHTVPEYKDAAKNNNPPKIVTGNKSARVSRIHIEFTGGTEGPQGIYEKLSLAGVDTIISMHQSEDHFKKCKEHNINVIFTPHIASDSLGVNVMLDELAKHGKIKIYELSGFRRFTHKDK
jgi:putative NIF3 family GTP cyclohydrolase 1 type 2